MPHTKIQQILKLSYDDLDREEKNIFLDIACFFKGRRVDQVKVLLDACGYSTSIGLKSLQDKALVTISNEEVSMHDLIQEMGWEIVREESLEDPSKRSRLWHANDIYEILKYNKGSEAIQSIKLDMSKIGELKLNPHVFANMHKLKFLEFYNSSSSLYLPQGLSSLPNEVRYLHWDNYPLKSLPLTFSAENVVQLYMEDSNIERLWSGVQNVVNLKVVNLSNSKNLMELPDFSKALHLEEVHLSHCASLCKVHPSILSLDRLKVLELNCCVGLTSLKSDIHLRSLSRLSLNRCTNLKEFSITSDNMTFLDLGWTAINELPSSIVCLSELRLSGCKNLKNIPNNLFGLRSLQELWMDDCCNILELPDNISTMSSLRELSIERTAVERLPASIKHLSSLKLLTLNKCTRLQYLPGLPPSTRVLQAEDCSSLVTVEFTSRAAEPFKPNLKRTYFKNCMKLDQHSIKAILANVLVEISKSVSQLENCNYEDIYGWYDMEKTQVKVVYPGSRVPDWFKYRTTHATSITIDISSAPLSMDWGFIFCFIAPRFLPKEGIIIKSKARFQSINDQMIDNNNKFISSSFRVYGGNLTSDHVCVCYDQSFCIKIHQMMKKNRTTFNPKVILKIDFHCQIDARKFQGQYMDIKECGVCPTYSSEYHNFIRQMELDSQAGTSEMGVGSSYKEEMLSSTPKQNSKDLIFRPLPTVSWKNRTQGLKDIVNL